MEGEGLPVCACGATGPQRRGGGFYRSYCLSCRERVIFNLAQVHRCQECGFTFWCPKCGGDETFCSEMVPICAICLARCGCNMCREFHPNRDLEIAEI